MKHNCLESNITYALTYADLNRHIYNFIDFSGMANIQDVDEAITKTCLYNFDPLKPRFCKVNLGFTGVYIIFLISAQNIDCGYSLESPHRGGSNEYPQSFFFSRN